MTFNSDRAMQQIEVANVSQRMYELIRQRGPIGDWRCETTFLDLGIEAFGITFGEQKGMDDHV